MSSPPCRLCGLSSLSESPINLATVCVCVCVCALKVGLGAIIMLVLPRSAIVCDSVSVCNLLPDQS